MESELVTALPARMSPLFCTALQASARQLLLMVHQEKPDNFSDNCDHMIAPPLLFLRPNLTLLQKCPQQSHGVAELHQKERKQGD